MLAPRAFLPTTLQVRSQRQLPTLQVRSNASCLHCNANCLHCKCAPNANCFTLGLCLCVMRSAGAATTDILHQYVSTIKALQHIDPSGGHNTLLYTAFLFAFGFLSEGAHVWQG